MVFLKVLNFKFKIVLSIIVILVLSRCNNNSNAANPPQCVSIAIVPHVYQCTAGMPQSPFFLATNGKGQLNVNVTGANTPNFSIKSVYSAGNPNPIVPALTFQNNTTASNGCDFGVPGNGSSPNDILFLSVPTKGAYQIKYVYIEWGGSTPNYPYNSSTCTPASVSNKCYRWVKIQDWPAGSIPSNFLTSIDVQDPTGFVGACE